jgi:hypothetical protein
LVLLDVTVYQGFQSFIYSVVVFLFCSVWLHIATHRFLAITVIVTVACFHAQSLTIIFVVQIDFHVIVQFVVEFVDVIVAMFGFDELAEYHPFQFVIVRLVVFQFCIVVNVDTVSGLAGFVTFTQIFFVCHLLSDTVIVVYHASFARTDHVVLFQLIVATLGFDNLVVYHPFQSVTLKYPVCHTSRFSRLVDTDIFLIGAVTIIVTECFITQFCFRYSVAFHAFVHVILTL